MDNLYQERINAVRELLPERQVDALLVTNITNCRWLTGFTGSACVVLITAGKALLATDSRYWEQAAEQAPGYVLFQHKRRPQDTAAFIRSAAVARIGIEAHDVTLQRMRDLDAVDGVSYSELDYPLELLRRIKSPQEIDSIRAAARITDSVMGSLPEFLRPGITEQELAWKLEKRMRELGASGMAFPPIVAIGSNSARPHHAPSNRSLQKGDILLVDMGAKLDGYCSDLTRTYLVGDEPNERFREIFDLVVSAQVAALSGIKAGVTSQEAHALAADVIAGAGFGKHFGHGLGHGVGLEIHEEPFMSATRPPQVLGEWMAITVEPGIYIPGWGGVRIEDLAVITDNGTVGLSESSKEPLLHVNW